MRPWTFLASIATVLLMATAVGAQTGASTTAAQSSANEAHQDGHEQAQKAPGQKGQDPTSGQPKPEDPQRSGPGQTQTGGDTRPSPADPAQAHKTGGNVGEGASYSRSTEKPAPDPQPK
jgi:hypothetical protein